MPQASSPRPVYSRTRKAVVYNDTDRRIIELRKQLGYTTFRALKQADKDFQMRTQLKAISLGLIAPETSIVNQ